MKQIQNSLMLLVVLVGIGMGCRKVVEVPIAGPTIEGKPSVASLAAQSLSRSGNTTQFSVDLFVINRSGRYVTGLQRGNFSIPNTSISGATVSHALNNLASVNQGSAGSGAYSALLLMDQSGSIAYSQNDGITPTDPDDLRISAAKIFLDYLGDGDQAGLASFSGLNSYATTNAYTVFHHGFSRNVPAKKKTLDSLASTEGGNTPLYLSTAAAIDYTARAASAATRRAVIVFTDGQNVGSYPTTLDQVIRASNDRQIPVFTVGLSRGVNVDVLSRMANETGGAFFFARDAEQLVTAFGTLGRLLRGSATLYRTTWTATRSSGTWGAGQALSGTINVNLPSGEIVEAPFWVQIK
jgi:hypothetical protein